MVGIPFEPLSQLNQAGVLRKSTILSTQISLASEVQYSGVFLTLIHIEPKLCQYSS